MPRLEDKVAAPGAVREIENFWITLADGCRLSARAWMPEQADTDPVPALLEYIPYRKNDQTLIGDTTRHAYFAAQGYASVRVDMRGTGDSDGVLYDEYLPQEQEDAVEVIAWLAAQPWCSGAVGMFGISWGGFNALQVAARRPPALRAILTLCSTDDRYADDVHYMGGCVLAAEMLGWSSTFFARKARPPDPAVSGERWRELWLERLEKSPPFVEEWLRHQRRDGYWEQGSVCEDYGAIECAVYAVGGWADAYRTAIFRLLERLRCPRRGLIGPWGHAYPEEGVPGPAIGFLQEAVRWWGHWLKGDDTGIMDEPMLRAWMQEPIEPAPFCTERPGRWVAEAHWPSERIERRSVPLEFPAERIRGADPTALDHGEWCPYGRGAELPTDQRAADGLSLCWTSEPCEERLEILGVPEVTLEVASDRPRALVAVRLCDVAPDGVSSLVTYGVLNLAHRESHARPEPLIADHRYPIRVRLNAIAHAIHPGRRLRVAVSPTYWPHVWPSPEPVTLSVFGGSLELPVRPPRDEDDALPAFGPPEAAPPPAHVVLRPPTTQRGTRTELASGRTELRFTIDYGGRRRLTASGVEFEVFGPNVFSMVDGDPLSAFVRCERLDSFGRGNWQTRVETASTMSADANAFHLTNALDAYEGAVRVFAKTWTLSVPRDLV